MERSVARKGIRLSRFPDGTDMQDANLDYNRLNLTSPSGCVSMEQLA